MEPTTKDISTMIRSMGKAYSITKRINQPTMVNGLMNSLMAMVNYITSSHNNWKKISLIIIGIF